MMRAIAGQGKEINKRLPAHQNATSARSDSPQRMLETLLFLNRSKLVDRPTGVLMEHHGNSKETGTMPIGTSHSDPNTVRSPNVSDLKSREFQLLSSPYPRRCHTKNEVDDANARRTASMSVSSVARISRRHRQRTERERRSAKREGREKAKVQA